jgi:hypothetical protein
MPERPCLVVGRVRILDVQHEADGGFAERKRAQIAHVRVLVRHHDLRIADL